MTAYELLELANTVNNRVDAQFALFISVHLAIFGGIIYVDRPLKRTEKLSGIAIYIGFALINYLMMIQQSTLLNALYLDASLFIDDSNYVSTHTVAFILNHVEQGGLFYGKFSIRIMHLSLLVFVMLTVFYDKPLKSNTKTTTV